MTYTQIALFAVAAAVVTDLFIARTRLLLSKKFWTAYGIMVFFQLLTNWWLTSRNIVMYSPEAIIGVRIASAPVEDLLFGFALVLLTLSFWTKE